MFQFLPQTAYTDAFKPSFIIYFQERVKQIPGELFNIDGQCGNRFDLSGAIVGAVKEQELARAAIERIKVRMKEPRQGQRQHRHD